MKFSQIDGMPIGELKLEALYAFFHEHAFFKFMDSGREGLKHATQDTIDNYATWIMARGPFGRGTLRKDVMLDEYLELNKQAMKLMVEGLIMNGSEGIHNAVRQIYLLTLDVVVEAQKPT